MKDFLKTMLAVICGVIVLKALRVFLFIIFFGVALASVGSSIPRHGVLDLDFSQFAITEQTQEGTPELSAAFSSSMVPDIGLQDAVNAVKYAADDPAVSYILLRAEGAVAGISDFEELRAALSEFHDSGKAIIAYMENPGNGSYYLSSVADKIYMGSQHGGNNMLIGLSAQLQYLKDILDKVGVKMQLIRHGKYKSAGETYIRSSASPENREQYQVLLNSVWGSVSDGITASRDLTREQLDALMDNLALNFPEDFLAAGLVDELVDHESLLARLCTAAQVEDAGKLVLISFNDYVSDRIGTVMPGRNNVAVIYADGEIVDGDDFRNVAGDRFVKVIDQVRKDKSIKAVVLRVNSPGGSVAASVKIRTALDELMKEKPLVASYGNYAASGGYWISNGCQKIYSDATTLTGSIGVFSMIPDFSGTAQKVGVGIESISTHRHSDMFSFMRPFDQAELDYMQASVEDIYEGFVNLVATSRDMTPEAVDAIAQGRVWAGTDALELGLVDEIGTLSDAIAYAAALADFHASDEYKVLSFPKPLNFFEQLMEEFGQGSKEPSILADTPFEAIAADAARICEGQPSTVYARLPYLIEIR